MILQSLLSVARRSGLRILGRKNRNERRRRFTILLPRYCAAIVETKLLAPFRAATVAWSVVMRTSAIDRLIYEALQCGVDTVVNFGAGLDTRPYRMKLPATLRWIEIDFRNIVDWINSMLVEHQPICKLERVDIDLLDRPSRNKILAYYETSSKNTLVITEGVLSYFSVGDAATLASDLHAAPSIRFWIQDFENAGRRSLPQGWRPKLEAAPFLFSVRDWFELFEKYGWQSSRVITSSEESQRINRPRSLDFPSGLILRALPRAMREKILSLGGAVLMQRVAPGSGKSFGSSENRKASSQSNSRA